MINKIRLYFFCILVVLFFGGCGKSEYRVFTNEETEAETGRIIDVIAEAVMRKDSELIFDEFSEYTKSKYNIKEKLDNSFNFIEGNIIEIQKKYAGISGSSYNPEYGETELHYTGKLLGVKTDIGKSYTITIVGVFYDRDNPDYIGINFFCVRDDDEEDDSKCKYVVGE